MTPDIPYNIRIRLAQLKKMLLPDSAYLCPVGCLSLEMLNLDSQQGRDLATSGRNKKIIGRILFLYYEESLVSSNLNSNLLMFHCAQPNLHIFMITCIDILLNHTEINRSIKISY